MTFKKKTAIGLVTLAATVLLAACSPAASNNSSSAEPTTTQVANEPVQAPTRTSNISPVAAVPLLTLNNEV